MLSSKRFVAAMFAVLITASAFATSAEAGRRYGPGGLGANLHRRHVLKQAEKRARQGKPVRGRASIWLTGPSSSIYRAVPGYRRW